VGGGAGPSPATVHLLARVPQWTIFAGTDEGVARSTDGGASWRLVPSSPEVVRALAVDPRRPRLVYAGGWEGVYRSEDGGESWTQVADSEVVGQQVWSLALDPTRPGRLLAAGERGVFRSLDAGATWSSASRGLVATSVSALAVDPPAANGNGSWHRRRGNGNGARVKEEVPPAAPAACPEPSRRAPSLLRILLEETDDPESDHERLRSLVNALRRYSGDCAVRLAIRQRDGAEVEMDLPRARPCPELTQALGDIVGPFGYVGG